MTNCSPSEKDKAWDDFKAVYFFKIPYYKDPQTLSLIRRRRIDSNNISCIIKLKNLKYNDYKK